MKFNLTLLRSKLTLRHAAALAPALLLLVTGCQSFKHPPTNNLSSVTITNRPLPQVASAINTVFAQHYFQGGESGPGEFTYERPGNRMNNLAYGSYFFDEKVTVRVVVTVSPAYGDRLLLSCNASLVEDAEDPVFEDDHPVRLLRKWPYEELLREIRKQLGE
jgi:hypothetical protein